VVDSEGTTVLEKGFEMVQRIGPLNDGERGVIYVRSYAMGEEVSEMLGCPFYKATAEDKGEILKTWIAEGQGWIVATGALGTGINIEGIRYVIHIDRPYGLTSFVQQSGRGGRNEEVSESIIVVGIKHTGPFKKDEEISAYSVEDIDERAMTEYIQSRECRRIVLGAYLDGIAQVSCHSIDGVLCDVCYKHREQERYIRNQDAGEMASEIEMEPWSAADDRMDTAIDGQIGSGTGEIERRLGIEQAADWEMFWAMDVLQKRCIYCELTQGRQEGSHEYGECHMAMANQCGMERYEQWRTTITLEAGQQCWECGLTQELCRRVEQKAAQCQYEGVMLVGIFIMMQQEQWIRMGWDIGFQGYQAGDILKWMGQWESNGVIGGRWEPNWMRMWRWICRVYMYKRVRMIESSREV
jgi:hypothetical protein